MNRARGAVAGGVAATAVLSLLLLLLGVQTREAVPVFAVVARFVGVPGREAVGFALFVAAGVFAWPLVFLAVEPRIPWFRDPAGRGVLLGAVLWVPFVLLGRGDIAGPLLVIYGGYTLIAHLVYGFVLGAVYARLTQATWRPGGPGDPRGA